MEVKIYFKGETFPHLYKDVVNVVETESTVICKVVQKIKISKQAIDTVEIRRTFKNV